MNQKKTLTILVATAFLLLLVVVVASTTLFVVDQRELAVVLEFGNPVEAYTEPGLNWKVPFIQEVRKLPKTRQFWGGRPQNELPDLPTADGKKVEVIPWAVWRINDPTTFVKVLVTMDRAEAIVEKVVRSAVRDGITKYDLADLVRSTNRELTYSFKIDASDAPAATEQIPDRETEELRVTVGRQRILAEIKERAMQDLTRQVETESEVSSNGERETGSRGIELIDVGIAKIGFVPEVRKAAFDRLIEFMNAIADYYTHEGVRLKQEILNQTNAEVQRIEGEGTKESNEIRGDVDAEIIRDYAKAIEETQEFYEFVRTLEAYKTALTSDTRLILTTDSEFLRLLKEPDVQKSAAAP